MRVSCYFSTFFFCFLLLISRAAVADHPSAGFGADSTGPIITVSATTLAEGEWSFSSRLEYLNLKTFTDEELIEFAEEDQHVHSTSSVLTPFFNGAYGVTDNFSLSFRIPYVARNNIREAEIEDHGHEEPLEGTGHGEEAEIHGGDARGIGDALVFGQYRFINTDESALQLALLAGVKFSTGSKSEKDSEGNIFETEHQPGSGSTDVLLGFAFTRKLSRTSVDSNVLYTATTKGSQETELGDLFHYNVGFSYRWKGNQKHNHDHTEHEHESHPHFVWDLILELNGEWQQAHKIAGVEDPNTGGNLVYVSPGMRIGMSGQWSVYFSVGIPIVNDPNGIQHETSFRIISGVGFGIW
ncbi:hypothetical protein L0156_20230 [bacterium]|nr:hypothetical protein [bacterium]